MTDVGDAVGQNHRFQSATIFKRSVVKTSDGVGNGEVGQSAATDESAVDARHASVVGDYAVFASDEQTFLLGDNQAIPVAVIDVVVLVYDNARQTAAIRESISSDFRYAMGNGQAFQACTAVKCVVADEGYADWEMEIFQVGAAFKGIALNGFEGIWKDNVFKVVALIECVAFYIRHAVGEDDALQISAPCKYAVFYGCKLLRKSDILQTAAMSESVVG